MIWPAGPVVPFRSRGPVQAHASAPRLVGDKLDHVATRGALVAFEQAPQLALQPAHVERAARVANAPAQAVEPGFNPAGEPLVHRALFLAALDGADQHGRLEAIRANTLLGFDAVAHGVLVAGLRNGPRPLPQLTLGRPDEIHRPGSSLFLPELVILEIKPAFESLRCQ